MKKTKALLLAGSLALSLLLAACGGNDAGTETPASEAASTPASVAEPAAEDEGEAEDDTEPAGEAVTIKVGASPAPHAEILEEVIPLLAAQNITLEIVEFSDYVLPNTALDDGDLDANYFQHLPYLENFNAENGTALVSAGGIHIEPMGVYPGKSDSLDSIPDGAQIGIPGDATNGGRALLLENLGLITLAEDAGLEAELVDIVDNPHNISFVELEAAQLPASVADLDFAVINGNYAIGAGINDTVLANEDSESPYVNIVAVREGDEGRDEIKALVAALQSDTIRDFINEKYAGEVLPVF